VTVTLIRTTARPCYSGGLSSIIIAGIRNSILVHLYDTNVIGLYTVSQ